MTGPPFEPHPSGADAIGAHAEGLAIYAGGAFRLAGDVRHTFAAAQSGVSGVLVGPMLHAPMRFYDTSDALHLAVMYAAGCVTLFADAVRTFNAGVGDLNSEWAAAVDSDFGVPLVSPDAARTRHGTDPTRLADLESDWTVTVDTARRELAAELRRRHHDLEGRLDDTAHDVAMRLRRGPTSDGVRALVRDGAFRHLFNDLSHRLDQLTPDPPNALQAMQESGTPYICDEIGCRPLVSDPNPNGDTWALGALEIGGEVLGVNDFKAALNGDPGAIAMLALDVTPVGKIAHGLKVAEDAAQLAHDAETAEDAADDVIDLVRLSHEESWADPRTLARHFRDHAGDFGAQTPEEYADMASAFFQRGLAQRLPTKVDTDGTIRIYDPATNTFGSYRPDGGTRTFYKPTSPSYWQRQPGDPI